MKTSLRASLLAGLALGLYPSCNDAEQFSILGPGVAMARTPVTEDPDANFHPNDDAEPNEYVVLLADDAYTPMPDPDASATEPVSPVGPSTSLMQGSAQTGIAQQTNDPSSVSQDVSSAYAASLEDSLDYVGAFTCTMSESQARAMSHDPRVARVEANAHTYCATTQINPGWGLDRIDQRTPLRFGTGNPNDQFTYNTLNGGGNIDAWVVDTGIWVGAADLQGRVVPEFPNTRSGKDNSCASLHPTYTNVRYYSSDDDCSFGHGSRVASAFGGTKWGAAKGVLLHAIKIAPNNGVGNIASLLAGLNYIYKTASMKNGRRSVVNISH